jgi:hypothetical protein
MCDRCLELDGKIKHYERIAASIADRTTLDGISKLVTRLRGEKADLHPKPDE